MNEKIYFNKVIMGAWVLVRKHKLNCNCSYCLEEKENNKKIRVVLPKCKHRTSWRRISYRNKDGAYTYLKFTLPKLSHFFGFDYSSWDNGFRVKILPVPIAHPNCNRSLLTYANPSVYKTKIKNVESLLWQTMVEYRNSNNSVSAK